MITDKDVPAAIQRDLPRQDEVGASANTGVGDDGAIPRGRIHLKHRIEAGINNQDIARAVYSDSMRI